MGHPQQEIAACSLCSGLPHRLRIKADEAIIASGYVRVTVVSTLNLCHSMLLMSKESTPDGVGSNPYSATNQQCDFREVAYLSSLRLYKTGIVTVPIS